MLTVPPLMDVASTITVACTDVALTSDQITAVKTEITTDPLNLGYKNATTNEIIGLLCAPFLEANPVAQGNIARLSWTMSDFYNFLLSSTGPDGQTPLIISLQQAVAGTDQMKALTAQNALNYINSPLTLVDLTDPQVIAGMNALLAEGLITQELFTSIMNQPDPNWQVQIRVNSRLSQLTGFVAGQVLTSRDISIINS